MPFSSNWFLKHCIYSILPLLLLLFPSVFLVLTEKSQFLSPPLMKQFPIYHSEGHHYSITFCLIMLSSFQRAGVQSKCTRCLPVGLKLELFGCNRNFLVTYLDLFCFSIFDERKFSLCSLCACTSDNPHHIFTFAKILQWITPHQELDSQSLGTFTCHLACFP